MARAPPPRSGATSLLGQDPHALGGGPRQQPEREPPGAGPGRADSSPVAYRTRAAAGGEAGGGLQEERRLADPRLAADEDERPRHEAAAEDAVELAEADRQARHARSSASAASATGCRRRDARRAGRGRAGGAARTTVSTREFQAPQARHWPSQRRKASPHDWQT